MQRIIIGAIAAILFNLGCVQLSMPAPRAVDVEALADKLAKQLSTLCPSAARDDVAAHAKCADGLSDATFIPWSRDGLLFGGDQPNLRISKRQLTHFKPSIWQFMYLSLFTFTGRQSVDEDPGEHIKVIHIEAYFRNAMPPGEYPYPFWHSADKWNAYETANELKFYLTPAGQVFVVTRSQGGSEAARGFAPALRAGQDKHLSCRSEIEFKFIGRLIGIPLIGTVPEGIRVFTGRHGVSKIRLDMDDFDVLSAVFIDRLLSGEGKKRQIHKLPNTRLEMCQ